MDTLPLWSQDDNPTKICAKCKRSLPATTDFFGRHKSNKDGFQYHCKQCRSIAKPRYIPPDGYKQCSKCKRDFPATAEYFCRRSDRKAGLLSYCKQCKSQQDKVYREEQVEKIKVYKQLYQDTHREQRKLYDTQHKERIDELRRRRAQGKKDLIRQQHREFCSVYYKTERGRLQMRVSSGNRRARKRSAQGTHTTDELYQQLQRQKSTCYYCHNKLGKVRKSWVAEHIIPLSRGGSNSIDNIVIACPDCNLSKGYKLPHEWGKRLL